MDNIGPYEVLEEAGQGGMGVVYHARDPRLPREVALKVLRTVDKRAVQRLRREAESLARLRHPHVVRVHDIEEHQGNPVLVMEWVAGESLQERINRQGPLEPSEAVGLARSLAEALAYAHGQGVLHRDVKPANVLLDETGAPRLTDFGIARLVDDQGPRLSQTGALIGSPGYFAPEQASGQHEKVGPWTDVYGLGGTLYAALTGGPPFAGMSLGELAVAAVEERPDPPSKRAEGIDLSLDAICLRCLEKEPGRRFASAADLADALAGNLKLKSGAPRWAVFALALAPAVLLGLVLLIALDRGPAAAPPPAEPPPPEVAPVPSSTPAERSPEVAANLARAKARYARKEYATALEAAQQVLQQEPDSLGGLTARALIQVELGARDEARQDIARLLALAPDSHLGYYALGVFEWKAGRLQEAVEVFGQALERFPDHVASLGHRSSCLNALGQVERAVVDVRRVLELEPDQAEARIELATYLLNTAQIDAARVEIDRAVAIEETAYGLCIRGTIRLAQGDREGALRDVNEAIERDPKLVDAYRTRGLLRVMDGDVRGGLSDQDQALKLRPDLQTRAERAQTLQELGEFARAERDIAEVLAAKPKDQGGLMLWARQAMLQEQYPEALRRVEIALAEYPDWPKLYGKRAIIRHWLGEYEGSIADCGRALRSSGEFYVGLRTRAASLAKLGRYAEAAADLRRLLAELPSHKRRDRPALERQLAGYEEQAQRAVPR